MAGNIHAYVFFEKSNQQTNTNVQDAWWDLMGLEIENLGFGIGVDVDLEGTNVDIFTHQFKITKIPSVVFVEDKGTGKGKVITSIAGSASKSQIKSLWIKVMNGDFKALGTDDGEGDTYPIVKGDDDEFNLGVGVGFGKSKLSHWLLLGVSVALSPDKHKLKIAGVGAGLIFISK